MQYYQGQPQWGTPQYSVAQPQQPYYTPQSNWGGNQYFQASLGTGYQGYDELREEGFFDSIWRGFKDIFTRGYSREDAAEWHTRVYGGVMSVDEMDAAQIGAAAGYEAVRHWSTYRSVYQTPLGNNREREKEALAGMAAGEALKLLQYSRRQRSRHTRREAAEVATATAERIFADDFEDEYEERPRLGRRSLGRRRSSSFGYSSRPVLAAATSSYVTGAATGVYQQPQSYVSAQPGVQYVQQGGYQQQVGYGTGGQVAYASTGAGYGQQPFAYAQPQYAQMQQAYTGVQQAYAQPSYTGMQGVYPQQQFMGAPQGYVRGRTLSTGGYPGYY